MTHLTPVARIFPVSLTLIVICLAAAPPKTTWVAIGDSITYLNDHRDETGGRLTKGFLTLITEKFPDVSYVNQGHNGWTAIQIAEKIESLGIVKADVYTVFLGTNDWWQGKPLGSIADYRDRTGTRTVYGAFRVIIDYLKELNPRARIILITPMPRGDFVYINDPENNAYGSYRPKNGQTLEEFANAVVRIAETEEFPVVDLYHDSGMNQKNMVNFKRLRDPATGDYKDYTYPAYTDIPFDPQKDAYPYPPEAANMTYDGLHPSDKGCQVIAGLLGPLLVKARQR